MRIASIPCGGPVGFFRSVGPMLALRERGHAAACVHESAGMTRAEQEDLIRSADLVSYVGPGRTKLFEDRPEPFQNMRGVLVVDYDDNPWAWVKDVASRDPAHLRMLAELPDDPQWKAVDDHVLACVESWVQGANVVTTTTEALAKVFREHGAKKVVVCPNALVPGFARQRPRRGGLEVVRDQPVTRAERLAANRRVRSITRGDQLRMKRVGWSGTVAHIADLPPVLVALAEIMSVDASVACLSLGPVKFTETPVWRGMNARPPAYKQVMTDMRGRDGKVFQSDTVPFEHYYQCLEAMAVDVAVIPMRASPLNEGKSDVTLLSWGIQGVPCVVSRFGPYAEAEREGFPAVYVDHDDADAWKKAVRDLLYDAPRARELGDAAQRWVLEKRCLPEAVDPWETTFEDACRAKGVEVMPKRSFAEVVEHETAGKNGAS